MLETVFIVDYITCMLLCRGEYTNLGQEADESQGQSPVRDKQQEDNDNPDVASRGDTHQLEAATRGGLEDQPSLAFFPADKTGYIAKVSCNLCTAA